MNLINRKHLSNALYKEKRENPKKGKNTLFWAYLNIDFDIGATLVSIVNRPGVGGAVL